MTLSKLIAIYLFLGGTSAGAYLCMVLLECLPFAWITSRQNQAPSTTYRHIMSHMKNMRSIVYPASLVLLVLGLLCLLADLGRPERLHFLFLRPTASYITFGTIALTLFGLVVLIACIDSYINSFRLKLSVVKISKLLGIPLSISVMIYTGLLLESVISIRLWQSDWLAIMFLLSALSCGCAVLLITTVFLNSKSVGLGQRFSLQKIILKADFVLIILEFVAGLIYFVPIALMPYTFMMLWGTHAILFWIGFVGCSSLFPLLMDAVLLLNGKYAFTPQWVIASIATSLLCGGCSLRFALVLSGVQVLQ